MKAPRSIAPMRGRRWSCGRRRAVLAVLNQAGLAATLPYLEHLGEAVAHRWRPRGFSA